MITVPFILVFTILAYFQGKFIRKHNVKLYLIFTILSVGAFVLRYKLPLTEPFNQGYIGLSFLYVVMVAGALKDHSRLRKKLMGIRREYSIIGFILITPHGLKYLIEFLQAKCQILLQNSHQSALAKARRRSLANDLAG